MSHYFVLMLFIACANIVSFKFGKYVGNIQSSTLFQGQILVLIKTVKKVDEILAFKGKSIKDLSVEELIQKIQEQLDLLKNA